MNLWNAILIALVIVIVAKAKELRRSPLDRYPTDANGNPIVPASRIPALKREMEDLRARVKMLETIIAEERPANHLPPAIDSPGGRR